MSQVAPPNLGDINKKVTDITLEKQRGDDDFVSTMLEAFPKSAIKAVTPGVVFMYPCLLLEYLPDSDNPNYCAYGINFPRCENPDADPREEESMWFYVERIARNHGGFVEMIREIWSSQYVDWTKNQDDAVIKGTWNQAKEQLDNLKSLHGR